MECSIIAFIAFFIWIILGAYLGIKKFLSILRYLISGFLALIAAGTLYVPFGEILKAASSNVLGNDFAKIVAFNLTFLFVFTGFLLIFSKIVRKYTPQNPPSRIINIFWGIILGIIPGIGSLLTLFVLYTILYVPVEARWITLYENPISGTKINIPLSIIPNGIRGKGFGKFGYSGCFHYEDWEEVKPIKPINNNTEQSTPADTTNPYPYEPPDIFENLSENEIETEETKIDTWRINTNTN